MTTETLLTQYEVDTVHARHVADVALTLFDHLDQVHGLPGSARRLLEVGALLHNVGVTSNPRLSHIVGRDIVLNADIAELSEDERTIVACLVSFHRKKVRPDQEPAYLSVKKKDRDMTLRLAALLRVADGLDYSGSQMTHISACEIDAKNGVLLRLSGPAAAEDGARAVKKADLWRSVLGSRLSFELAPASPTEATLAAPAPADVRGNGAHPDGNAPAESLSETEEQVTEPVSQPMIGSEDTLADAGRRLLRRHFQKLLAQEPEVQADTEIEAVHRMRVATRRLRAALMILEAVAPPKQVRRSRKGLRRLAQTSSAVRDCDVFLEHVTRYAESLPQEQRGGLEPLVTAIQRDRTAARAALLQQLDSRKYAEFKRDFAAFMTGSLDGWNTTVRIRDLAGSIIWQRYEALRAHEVRLDLRANASNDSEELHETRISGKRLRYVLEMFAEALGPRIDQALDTLKEFQDHLGSLQDIAVAQAYVAALDTPEEDRGALDAYTANRESERAALLADLPRLWDKLMSATYRRRLMELIVKL